jgi:hypothetical protein
MGSKDESGEVMPNHPSKEEAMISLDELRVVELEPRLEFVTEICNYAPGGGCGTIQVFDDSDPDFWPLIDEYPCPGA